MYIKGSFEIGQESRLDKVYGFETSIRRLLPQSKEVNVALKAKKLETN
jgi:hypothetical protein